MYGRDGLSLTEYWSDGMKTYHGFLSHGFPNCFHMGLTQTGLAPNFTYMLNGQATHIAHIISQVGARELKSVEPTREAEADWVDAADPTDPDDRLPGHLHSGLLQRRGQKRGGGLYRHPVPRGRGALLQHARRLA